MGETTQISWCDSTFNPWIGCAHVSPGCERCYAEIATPTRRARAEGRELWGAHALRQRTSSTYWNQPYRWSRAAIKGEHGGRACRVFCASLADWLEDRPDLVDVRADLLEVIFNTPGCDWLMLTKRIENFARLLSTAANALAVSGREAHAVCVRKWLDGDAPGNVWLGVTTEDQKRADSRLLRLYDTPATIRFASYEPALELVKFPEPPRGSSLDWIIAGGESGTTARPFNVGWARVAREQAYKLGAAYFMKQMGSNGVRDGAMGEDGAVIGVIQIEKKSRKGGDLDDLPIDLRIREHPAARTVAT